MIQLSLKDFKNLLSDIYTAFAPSKLEGVDALVEKYIGSAMDQRNAIQMAFLKYVNPASANYLKYSHILPDVGTEKNILFLMESYARGERMITEETLSGLKREENERKDKAAKELKEKENKLAKEEQERLNKVAEEEEIRLAGIREDQKNRIQSNEELVEELRQSKEDLNKFKENAISQIEDYKKELDNKEPKQVSAFEDMELEIISFEEPDSRNIDGTIEYKLSDIDQIKMPPKKYIATLCIGQRFMTSDTEGKIVGIEVTGITDDYVSDPEKPTRMINLRKA